MVSFFILFSSKHKPDLPQEKEHAITCMKFASHFLELYLPHILKNQYKDHES